MRLTLRTLLAYLDDRLTPANARDLGQKLAKSPFAMELAQRIKDVVRRRRLAGDASQHKLIDPNLVAEYLDDQLTPELIALIEKEILSSDYSLAEVAATHQILGLLTDPVEIEPGLKERLYQLDPTVQHADDNHVAAAGTVPGQEQWTPLQKPADSPERSPMILLTVMVLGWLVLLATDPHLFNGEDPAVVAEVESADEPDAQLDPGDAESVAAAESTDAAAPSDVDDQPSVAPTTDSSDAPAVVADATDDVPTSMPPTVPPSTDDGGTSQTDPAAVKPPVAGQVPDPVATDSEAAVVESIELTENAGVVFLQQTETGWVRASTLELDPGTSWIQPLSEHFALVGPPFQTRLIAPGSGWAVRVLGPSVVRISKQQPLTLQLLEGRLLLQQFGDERPTTAFHLETGRAALQLTVPAADSAVAISVDPLPVPPESLPPSDVQQVASATLLPVQNHCEISISAIDADAVVTVAASGQDFSVSNGSTWQWTTDSIANAANTSVEKVLPDWALSAETPPTAIQRQLIAASRAALNAGGSIVGSLQEMAGDRNPQIAAFAVQHLTLMREVDNLVTLLMTSDQEQPARQEAILGLNRIALLAPAGPASIRAALATRLPETDLDDAMKLILGITKVAAEDPGTSTWLVGMLDHSRSSFRELAIFNLERLTGERNGFFATDETSRRDSAVRRWERFLERNDGRLLQPPN